MKRQRAGRPKCLDCIGKSLGEEQLKPTAGKFRVGGRVCEVETEECWENVEPRSALVCKTCTPAPDPVSETKP